MARRRDGDIAPYRNGARAGRPMPCRQSARAVRTQRGTGEGAHHGARVVRTQRDRTTGRDVWPPGLLARPPPAGRAVVLSGSFLYDRASRFRCIAYKTYTHKHTSLSILMKERPFRLMSLVVQSLCVLILALLTGCEGSDDNNFVNQTLQNGSGSTSSDSGTVNSGIVGSWSLTDSEGNTWYIHFESDRTWMITDGAGKTTRRRVYGTYSTSGNSFTGDMTNPNVGTGEIRGSISGTSITLDFIEHWHNPYKVIAYTGSKL